MKKIEDCRKFGAYHQPNNIGGCYYCKTQGIKPFTLSKITDAHDRRKTKR